jgi:hypothetical protein
MEGKVGVRLESNALILNGGRKEKSDTEQEKG